MACLALSGLLGPRTSEDASEHFDVPFVARELLDVVLGCAQANDGGPWLHPRGRIIDRHLVVDRVGARPRETLREMQAIRRAHEVALRREVRRVDDERVAFPMAARVAVQLRDAL